MRLVGPWERSLVSMISRTICFNTLPDAFVGRGECCASNTLGSMKEERPLCLQASFTDAADNLGVLSMFRVCTLASASAFSLQITSLLKLSNALTCNHIKAVYQAKYWYRALSLQASVSGKCVMESAFQTARSRCELTRMRHLLLMEEFSSHPQ